MEIVQRRDIPLSKTKIHQNYDGTYCIDILDYPIAENENEVITNIRKCSIQFPRVETSENGVKLLSGGENEDIIFTVCCNESSAGDGRE